MKTLILGGSSDMAIALVEKLLNNGEKDIILASRKAYRLEGFLKNWQHLYGAKVYAIDFEAADYHNHSSFVVNLPFEPDTVVSYLGYLGDHDKAEKDFDECMKIFSANTLGLISVINELIPILKNYKNACIVGVSSVAGERGRQSNYLYGSAKAATTAYLSGLRNRLASEKVHVVTVKPGFVFTKMTADLELPNALTAKPEETANAIFKSIKKQKNVIYVKPVWRYIMLIIKLIPEPIFKKLKL